MPLNEPHHSDSIQTAEVPNQPLFTEADVARWKDGTEKFREFWKKIPEQAMGRPFPPHEKNPYKAFDKYQIGEVQALFLGEKPACYGNGLVQNYSSMLQNYGYVVRQDKKGNCYAFDQDQLATLMVKQPNFFHAYKAKSVEDVMHLLAQAEPSQQDALRGIVLGYPYESVEQFLDPVYQQRYAIYLQVEQFLLHHPEEEHVLIAGAEGPEYPHLSKILTEKARQYQSPIGLNAEQIAVLEKFDSLIQNRNGITIYGVTWAETRSSGESQNKQARLKAAFEMSGILEVVQESADRNEQEQEPLFTETDVKRWQAGADLFRKFWEQIPEKEYGPPCPPGRMRPRKGFSADDIGEVEAVFLGEKPASYANTLVGAFASQLRDAQFQFSTIQDKSGNWYVYRPEKVQEVLNETSKSQVFEQKGLRTAEQVMEYLADHFAYEAYIIRGLTLGYPDAAVEYHEVDKLFDQTYLKLEKLLMQHPVERARVIVSETGEASYPALAMVLYQKAAEYQQELGLTDTEMKQLKEMDTLMQQQQRSGKVSKGVNIYGVTWGEIETSAESQHKQARLKAAFEMSGILNVVADK